MDWLCEQPKLLADNQRVEFRILDSRIVHRREYSKLVDRKFQESQQNQGSFTGRLSESRVKALSGRSTLIGCFTVPQISRSWLDR